MLINIYRILFENNYNTQVFFFIMGLFLAECFFLYRLKKTSSINNAVVIAITAISLVFSMVAISRPNELTEAYDLWYAPKTNGNGCMVEGWTKEDPSGDVFINTGICDHYIDTREVAISSKVETKDDVALWVSTFSRKSPVTIVEEFSAEFSSDVLVEITNNTNCLEKDSRKFILDKTWGKSTKIICIQAGDSVYFISEELYHDIENGSYEQDYLSEKDLSLSGYEYMNKQRGERSVNQMIILAFLFMLGWVPCVVFFRGRMSALSAFMSFPVGISITTLIGVVMVILGVPFRKIVLLGLAVILLAVMAFIILKFRPLFEIKKSIKVIVAMLLINFVVVDLRVFKYCTDGARKVWCAYQLSEGLITRGEALANFMCWGMMEPVIHCIGIKFKADIVYGLYLGTFICSIGMIITATYYLSKKNNRLAVVALAVMCAAIYASNNDAFIIGIWALSNGPMGCMILSIAIALFVSYEKDLPTNWLVVFLAFVIFSSRVEGGTYVGLLLVLFSGIAPISKKFIRFNMVIGAELVLWEIVNMIITTAHLTDHDRKFWSPEKAKFMVIAGVAIALVPVVLGINCKLINFVKKHFYKFAIGMPLMVVVIAIASGNQGIIDTAAVYTKHFATGPKSNSLAMWGFFLLMLPLLLNSKKKKSGYLLSIVIDYILVLFMIFAVRGGWNMIHTEIGDSSRRTLQQIYSTAMLIIPLIWNELFDGSEGISTKKECQ